MLYCTPLWLCVLIIFTGCLPGDERLPITGWSMLVSESESIPGDTAPGWSPISIPSMFRHPVTRKGGFSHVWLRGTADVTGDVNRFAGIHLGRVYYTDRTYINGIMVGSRTEDEIQAVHNPGNYTIPGRALKPGKNSIHIRLGIYGKEFGGISGTPVLMAKKEFFRQGILDNFIYSQLPIGIVIYLLSQALFNLALFYYNRSEKVNIYAVAILAGWSLYILSLFSPWFPFSTDVRVTFLWSCTSSYSILYMLFIQSYYRFYLTWHNRIIIPVLLAVTLLIWAFPDTTSPYYPGRVLGLTAMFAATFVLLHVIYTIKKIKRDASITLFICLGFIPGFFIIWDILNYQFINHIPPLTHTYTIPFISTLIIIYIVRDLISSKIALTLLYAKLDAPAPAPAVPAETPEKSFTVTTTAETKLKRVISFLDENYRSNISREGLAGSIGMSPDHLSRIFMSYTGKKIQDYINEKRVDDAKDQLANTENRIIDIAFSIGYENLATFNRIFLKTTGSTPSDYRKNQPQKIENSPQKPY